MPLIPEMTDGKLVSAKAQYICEALAAISSAITDIHNDGRANEIDIRNMQGAVEELRKLTYGIYCHSKNFSNTHGDG